MQRRTPRLHHLLPSQLHRQVHQRLQLLPLQLWTHQQHLICPPQQQQQPLGKRRLLQRQLLQLKWSLLQLSM
jgi:hypothetical protein